MYWINKRNIWDTLFHLDSKIMILWTVAWARAGCFGWDIDLKIKFIDIRRMSTADFFMNILLHVKITLYVYSVTQNILPEYIPHYLSIVILNTFYNVRIIPLSSNIIKCKTIYFSLYQLYVRWCLYISHLHKNPKRC